MRKSAIMLLVPMLGAACVETTVSETGSAIAGERQNFDIAAETRSCRGLAPTRCLVVNGELFYGSIEGYRHVEGKNAKILRGAIRARRPAPSGSGGLPIQTGRLQLKAQAIIVLAQPMSAPPDPRS